MPCRWKVITVIIQNQLYILKLNKTVEKEKIYNFQCFHFLDKQILFARSIPRNRIGLFLPRLKKFEETFDNISEDDLINNSMEGLEFEPEMKYPKASIQSSLFSHGITTKTKLITPKRKDNFGLKQYARMTPCYQSGSMKKRFVVNQFAKLLVRRNCFPDFDNPLYIYMKLNHMNTNMLI